jgi:Tol biopolymer transport system component
VGCHGSKASLVEHDNVAFDVSPDGSQVVFSSADGDLFLFDLDARKVTRLTTTGDFESTPAYSVDGKSVIYTSATEDPPGGRICSISLDGSDQKQLTNDAEVFDRSPIYSPDGSQIAFARAHRHRPYSMGGWTWDDWDVYVMNVDNGNVRRLSTNKYYGISGIEFSADGKQILFSADNNRAASDLDTNVFELPADGSAQPKPGIRQPTAASKFAAWASEPDISTNGERMVVISDRDSSYQYDLVVIELASGNAKSLGATSVSRYNQQPVFTPSGKRILFLAGTEFNAGSRPVFSLWMIDADGKNAKELADSQLFTAPEKSLPPK